MRRRLSALALAAGLVLTLTACGQTVDDVKRDGEFAKACHDAGGHTFIGGFDPQLRCSFVDR